MATAVRHGHLKELEPGRAHQLTTRSPHNEFKRDLHLKNDWLPQSKAENVAREFGPVCGSAQADDGARDFGRMCGSAQGWRGLHRLKYVGLRHSEKCFPLPSTQSSGTDMMVLAPLRKQK
jgi:hypothetical protein